MAIISFILYAVFHKNKILGIIFSASFVYFSVSYFFNKEQFFLKFFISVIFIVGVGIFNEILYAKIEKNFLLTSYITGMKLNLTLTMLVVCIFIEKFIIFKNAPSLKFIIFYAFLILLINLAMSNKIKISKYKFESEKINSKINIICISDLHSTIFGNNQDELIEKIKSKKPDLILMSGDMGDDIRDFKGTELLLKGIKDTAPIFYVMGNHEYKASNERYEQFFIDFKKYGVEILNDTRKKIIVNNNVIYIMGLTDVMRYRKNKSAKTSVKILKEIYKDTDDFKILLSHRPEIYQLYEKYNYDIIFSGHAHGGQVIIPFIVNGLYTPNQGFFPKYAGGVYKIENGRFIVGRGLSVYNIPRVFNPPELVWVVLEPVKTLEVL